MYICMYIYIYNYTCLYIYIYSLPADSLGRDLARAGDGYCKTSECPSERAPMWCCMPTGWRLLPRGSYHNK